MNTTDRGAFVISLNCHTLEGITNVAIWRTKFLKRLGIFLVLLGRGASTRWAGDPWDFRGGSWGTSRAGVGVAPEPVVDTSAGVPGSSEFVCPALGLGGSAGAARGSVGVDS